MKTGTWNFSSSCRPVNQHDLAVRILWRLAARFPLDLLVHTPQQMTWRLKQGESFLTTIVSKGKVLYEIRAVTDRGHSIHRGAQELGWQPPCPAE